MEVYNLERKTDDIKRILEEKQQAGQEPQGEVDEGQQGEPTANLDATIIAKDQVITEVGHTDPQDTQPTERKRRKLIQCLICRPSRTFTDEEKLAQHMSVFHVFD